MQKLKKAPQKTVTPSAKSAKNSASGVKPAAIAAKKAPAVKKKTQPIVVTKKNVPAKPVDKNAARAAAGKKAHAKAPVHKGAKPAEKPPVKQVAQKAPPAPAKAVDAKKKLAIPAGKPPAGAAKAPVKVAPKKAEVVAEKVVAKTEKKEAPVTEAKAKKGRDEVETIVEATQTEEEVILTDADGRRYCRVKDCDQAATVDGGYCRFHYLLFWKNIQSRRKILSEGKLERYIEELTARYPDKYLELLRKDLRSEKDFTAAIQELEIDDSGVDNEFEDEAQSYLDEVRGMSTESNSEREEEF